MKFLVFLAVAITVVVLLMYYFPKENVIDYFSLQKHPTGTTGTVMNKPDPGGTSLPFADLAMAPDGTSPLQSPKKENVLPKQPQVQQPTPAPRQAKSSKDKILKLAAENSVTITMFNENPIGTVILTCEAKDKNNIFDFQDALLKFGIRDFDQVPGGYKVQMDADGRTLVTGSYKIKYIPEY